MLSPKEMVAEICNADSNGDAANLYARYHPHLQGSQIILASDKGNSPGATINRNFTKTAVVRGLFKSEKILVLDETTFLDMLSGKATYSYDQSIALDTMTLSYIEPYINQGANKVPKDFVEVFEFIADDKVNVDPLPYMRENLSNLSILENRIKIKRKLRGYEVLRTLDKSTLLNTGEARSILSEQDLEKRAEKTLSNMIRMSKSKELTATLIYRHRIMSCLLFKMVEIQLRNQNRKTVSEKLYEFFEFQNDQLATLYARESIIAKAYFEQGTSLGFFSKMHAKQDDIFEVLRGMAWDLLHIRHMEEAVSARPEKSADYFFPAFLTFDDRLVKIIDLYPLKACAVFGDRKEVMPFYDGNFLGKITEEMSNPTEFISRFYSKSAISRRNAKRHGDYRLPRSLKKKLGNVLADLAQVPFQDS